MAQYDITTAGARLNFNGTNNSRNAIVMVDENHFLGLFQRTNSLLSNIFEVNTTTYAITTATSDFDNGGVNQSGAPALIMVDDNHALAFYNDSNEDGAAQVYEINTTTWAITTAADPLLYDTTSGNFPACARVDTNHFINFWHGDGGGNAEVFVVDTTTWEVTTAAAKLIFDAGDNDYNACAQIDTNHYINFWRGVDGDGFAQVFTVNTTTFVISTTAAVLEFETQDNAYNSCYKIDTNHVINFWRGADGDGFAQVFEVNTTTFAVTTSGAVIEFDASNNAYNTVTKIDLNHFVNFYSGNGSDGYAEVYEVNTSTWAISTASTRLEFNTDQAVWITSFRIDTEHWIGMYSGDTFAVDGFVQSFHVDVPLTIITEAVTDIETIQATGNGEIVYDGGETITERGFVWATTPDPTTSDGKVIVPGGPEGVYSGNLTGLTPDTLYYVRAYCISGLGTIYGENATFTTGEIEIITNAATDIQVYTALGHGNVIDDGGETITERGFVWGVDPNPTTADDKLVVAGTTGEYEGSMTGLEGGTLYHYRAYLITSSGTYYGDDETFTTQAANGRIGALDTGFTDFGESFYFEIIDRWRNWSDMYAKSQAIDGLNIYNENAGGTKILYQTQKAFPNVWDDLGTIDENASALLPNASTEDFNAVRLRITGITKGDPIVFHGIEVLEVQVKGYDKN